MQEAVFWVNTAESRLELMCPGRFPLRQQRKKLLHIQMIGQTIGQPVDALFPQLAHVGGLLCLQTSPVQQRIAGTRFIKQAVQVAAQNLVIRRAAAIRHRLLSII